MPNPIQPLKRRDFLRLAACGGGVAFASALPGWSFAANAGADFFFVQLSDAHWGFTGPAINPDARGTLPKAIEAVNALPVAPDFVMFTGDLTHTTDDPAERRARMRQFQSIVAQLRAKPLHLMPGEHDASLDAGAAYREIFGDTHYAFDHKGVHFVVVDNVSDPAGRVGDAQIEWLARISRDSRRTRASSSSRTGRSSISRRNGTGPRATARRSSTCWCPIRTSPCSTDTSIRSTTR